VGATAVMAGMTAGATAGDVTGKGQLIFKFMMFGLPMILVLAGTYIFFKKVTLDEDEHAKIVAELEKTWHEHLDTNETPAAIDREHLVTTSFQAPVSGRLMALDQVGDQNFASGEMGTGYAIQPTDGEVHAPFSGTVEATFPTRHAIGLRSDSGILALIHIGVDTVKLNGTGFVQYVDQGDHVTAGQELIEFWAPAIHDAGLDDTVMVVITNRDALETISWRPAVGTVHHGDELAKLAFKD